MNYPENSIEGIISAMMMGADNIEIDLQRTRDDVVVLMHDETLTRTTDWALKKGTGGLPESEYVVDWTYEQLCALNLKNALGQIRDYQIPTLREAFEVCRGRTTLRLDKLYFEVWGCGGDFSDAWEQWVIPLAKECGALDICSLFDMSLEEARQVKQALYTAGAEHVIYFYTLHAGNMDQWENATDLLAAEHFIPLLHHRTINPRRLELFFEKNVGKLALMKGRSIQYIQINIIEGGDESPETWEALHEAGIDFIMVDMPLNICKYIAQNSVN